MDSLTCPCCHQAEMVLVENVATPHFRTKAKNEHQKGCPYNYNTMSTKKSLMMFEDSTLNDYHYEKLVSYLEECENVVLKQKEKDIKISPSIYAHENKIYRDRICNLNTDIENDDCEVPLIYFGHGKITVSLRRNERFNTEFVVMTIKNLNNEVVLSISMKPNIKHFQPELNMLDYEKEVDVLLSAYLIIKKSENNGKTYYNSTLRHSKHCVIKML